MIPEPMIGEVRFWANRRDMSPQFWLRCDGKSLPVSQYGPLFSVIQYAYGGSGAVFNLPNLDLRSPMGAGAGPGLTHRPVGSSGGTASEVLSLDNLPGHHHVMQLDAPSGIAVHAVPDTATDIAPMENGYLAKSEYTKGLSKAEILAYGEPGAPSTLVRASFGYNSARGTIHPAGRANPAPRDNRQPFLTFGFFIAYKGETPPRS